MYQNVYMTSLPHMNALYVFIYLFVVFFLTAINHILQKVSKNRPASTFVFVKLINVNLEKKEGAQ